MARTIFEYTDDRGKTHQVTSLDQVPKKHIHTMVAIGVDEKAEAAKTLAAAAPPKPTVDPRLQKVLDTMQKIPLTIAVPVVLVLTWWKFRHFIVRVLVFIFALVWGFHVFYTWFESSEFSKPSERKRRPPPPVEETAY